jgi:hypothetical protein
MRSLLLLGFLLIAFDASADSASVATEVFYNRLVTDLENPSRFVDTLAAADKLGMETDPVRLAIDVLWNMSLEDGEDFHNQVSNVIDAMSLDSLSVGDKIRVYIIASKLGHTGSTLKNLRGALATEIAQGKMDKRSAIIAYSHQEFLKSEFGSLLTEKALAKNSQSTRDISELASGFEPKSKQEIKELVLTNVDLARFRDGQYQNTSKIFMFCRHNRNYPCRYLIKGKNNRLQKNDDGSLWTQPSLGQSAKGLPYNVTSGYTPSGVLTIDSVMPDADNQAAFGRFRRFILNFIPESSSEAQLKMTLPPRSRANNWWKESTVARDAGRSQLRIHGTGRHNDDPESTFYPHMRTSGCVSQLEGEYPNESFKDQRSLLKMFLTSLGLQPVFENEPAIKGLLYVVEVDDVHAPVRLADIKQWLDL